MLVISIIAQKRMVEHACPRAHRAGARPGMSLAHARALVHAGEGSTEVVILPHEPTRDIAALAALARWCIRWTPLARAHPPDGILMDITGCEHLFGGERGLAGEVRAGLARLGFTARIAIAGTVGAAWAVARFARGETAHVHAGGEREAIAGLPIAALRVEPGVRESLGEVGITTIGGVLDLPRSTLPSRYGPVLLTRIDQALGTVPEPVDGIVEDEPPQLVLELFGGTTHVESIASAIRTMLAALVVELRRREAGVRRLDLHFTRLEATRASMMVELSCPTRSRSHLWSLLEPRLERLHMGEGIERIEVHAARLGPIAHEQGGLAGIDAGLKPSGSAAELSRVLETMASRLGADRLHRIVLRASHRPERSYTLTPALAPPVGLIARAMPLPRPSCLLDPPEPARAVVLLPEGPLLRLWWRGHEHTLTACIGPERIGGEWWFAREPSRDYFRVQDQHGVWLWVFRNSASGEWFVHGVWA